MKPIFNNLNNLVGGKAVHPPNFCAQEEASGPAAVEGDVLVEGILGTAVHPDCQQLGPLHNLHGDPDLLDHNLARSACQSNFTLQTSKLFLEKTVFSIDKSGQSGLYSGLPFLVMSVLCLVVSSVAEAMINSGKFSVISVRRLMNSIGQYVPALGLVIVAFAGCDTTLTVTALALGFGCNAATFSGFQVWKDQPSLV